MFLLQIFCESSFSTLLLEHWMILNKKKRATILTNKDWTDEIDVTYLFVCSTMYREVRPSDF